jgi:hypothetical protein
VTPVSWSSARLELGEIAWCSCISTLRDQTADGRGGEGTYCVVLHKLCFSEEALGRSSTYLTGQSGPSVYDDAWTPAYAVPGEPTVPMALREGV